FDISPGRPFAPSGRSRAYTHALRTRRPHEPRLTRWRERGGDTLAPVRDYLLVRGPISTPPHCPGVLCPACHAAPPPSCSASILRSSRALPHGPRPAAKRQRASSARRPSEGPRRPASTSTPSPYFVRWDASAAVSNRRHGSPGQGETLCSPSGSPTPWRATRRSSSRWCTTDGHVADGPRADRDDVLRAPLRRPRPLPPSRPLREG